MQLFNLLFVLFFVGAHCCGDYYWRDYDGRIPADAIPAGKNTETGTSYVGQAYIHNFGTFYGTLTPGKVEIFVPCYGVKRTDILIQILCAPDPSKYSWKQIHSNDYVSSLSSNKICPIKGAYDQNKGHEGIPLGELHVGRVNMFGSAIIGNIAYYNQFNGNLWFYYPVRYEEKRTQDFDVLVYNDNNV